MVSYAITAFLNIKISFDRIRDILKIKVIEMKNLNDELDKFEG
jgi:hypothetical protein